MAPTPPKLPYAGKMARLTVDKTIEQCLVRAAEVLGGECEFARIPSTGWTSCWLRADKLRGRVANVGDGQKAHPFLIRFARRTRPENDAYLPKLDEEEKKFLILGLDADTVDDVLEAAGVAGRLVTPTVDVDRLVRELVSPSPDMVWPGDETLSEEDRVGRPYLIGSIYAGIEGYGRDLRNVAFFGDSLADAKLFQRVLGNLSSHRVGVRETADEKREILSVSGKGEVSLQTYRGAAHLAAIDRFTQFMRANGLIDWREGGL